MNKLTGVGLRSCHLHDFANTSIDIGWLEIHSENFISFGGVNFDYLLKIREKIPISIHGIGMSLGSADGINKKHLSQVKELINIIDPFLVSEHLSWSAINNQFVPELLPAPLTKESLSVFEKNINLAQEYLQKEILIENPSTYFEYNISTYSEPEFLNILCNKTGAKLLLDINNIYVSCLNNKWDPKKYLDQIDTTLIKEYHLAGHSSKVTDSGELILIDTHNSPICTDVLDLYEYALQKSGAVYSMIEWDQDIPAIEVLMKEAKKIENCINKLETENV